MIFNSTVIEMYGDKIRVSQGLQNCQLAGMFSRKPKRLLPSDNSILKKLERQMIGIVEKENRKQVLIGYHKIKFLQFMNLWKTLPKK